MRKAALLALAFALIAAPLNAADREGAEGELIKGTHALKAGDVRMARDHLAAAIKADPEWALAHAVQGKIYLELKDSQNALTEFNRALELKIEPRTVNHLVAQIWLLNGDPVRALNEASSNRVDPPFQAAAARVRARALIALGDYRGAEREFDDSARMDPKSPGLWMDVARYRYQIANLVGAQEAAANAAALNPGNPEALLLMADLVRGQFGPVASLPWYDQALARDPGNLRAMGDYAATLGDVGQTKKMLDITRQMLRIDKDNPQAFLLQAVLAARAGNYDLARSLLYRTNDRMDDLPSVMLLDAVLSLDSGNEEQAIGRLHDLLDKQPNNIAAKKLLGTAFLRQGDAQSAIETLRPLADQHNADNYALTILGRAYEAMDDRTAAAAFLDRAAQPMPSEPAPFGMTADFAMLTRDETMSNADVAIPRISQMMRDGRAADALGTAQTLQDHNRGTPAAYILVGDVLVAAGRAGEAIGAYRAAASIRFDEVAALRMVDAQNLAGDGNGALVTLDTFLQQNPRNVPALRLASQRFLAAGQWTPASAILENLKDRLGNRNGAILNDLGWVWFNRGNPEKAIGYARTAYSIAPANPAVAGTYGLILFKSGKDKKGGVALMQKSLILAPENAALRAQLDQAVAELSQKG